MVGLWFGLALVLLFAFVCVCTQILLEVVCISPFFILYNPKLPQLLVQKDCACLSVPSRRVDLTRHWCVNPSIHTLSEANLPLRESYLSLTTSLFNGRCDLLSFSFVPYILKIYPDVQKETKGSLNHKW